MKTRPWLLATFAMATTALSGCDVGPDYRHPVVALPAGWREAGGTSHAVWPAEDWWRGFGSPQLNDYIARAEAQNFDIAAAVARVREADAQVRIAGATLLPSVGATASGGPARSVLTTTSQPYRLPAVQSWPERLVRVRLLGQEPRHAGGRQGNRFASRYDQEVIALATVCSVAATYFQALSLRDRIDVAEKNVAAAEQMLGGIHTQFQDGTVTDLNIAQQETVVNGLRALIPPLRQQFAQAIDALAILIGEPPEHVKLAPETLLDLSMPAVAPGLPAESAGAASGRGGSGGGVDRRQCQYQGGARRFLSELHADRDRVEWRAWQWPDLPRRPRSSRWQAALRQPIFEGGLLRGQLEYSKARYTELLEDYRKSIISALSNVEDGLAGVQQTGDQVAAEAATVKTAQRAYEISAVQYHAGTVDLLTVLTAENALFPDEDLLVQARLAHVQALVSLFQALGGGWQDGQIQSASAQK